MKDGPGYGNGLSLSSNGVFAVLEPLLRVACQLVLANAQSDKPTQRVFGSVGLSGWGPKWLF